MNPVAGAVRPVRRFIGRIPGIGLTNALPNTARFLLRSYVRRRRVPIYPDPPAPRVTAALAAQVALDETVLGIMRSPRAYPKRVDYHRVGQELRDAEALYESEGWLDDPSLYHTRPPALSAAEVTAGRGSVRGLRFERISFPSGYEPHAKEPGRDRWLAFVPNRTAHAWLLDHADGADRPWLVCVHGFGMGSPLVDFQGFRAARLHRELGLNLAFPVLPLHGPRKVTRISGTNFMSYDFMHGVFGLSQAVWDTRRLMSWLVAERGAQRVGIYGLSLGAYVSSLAVNVIEPDRIDAIVSGIPVSDFPRLFRHHSPPTLRRRAVEHGLLGETVSNVHRMVSPLALPPRVPKDRRFIFAALGDRMSTPGQAHELWMHWDRPRIQWYEGTHVAFMLSSSVDGFVRESLREALLDEKPNV